MSLYGMYWCIGVAQHRDQWRGFCVHGNEPSGPIKCWVIIEQLNNGWSLKDSTPWS
jgi:hypothetical protein